MARRPSLAKGLLAGVAAGIAATVMMDQFQNLLAAGQKAVDRKKKLAAGESEWEIAHERVQQQQEQEQSVGSTERVALKVADVVGTSLPKDRLKAAGQVVHYTFGTLMGLVYSATAEWVPEIAAGSGAAFGTLLFLTADEVAVPAFHLSGPPTETPVSNHLQYWAAHLVYGTTLEASRNLLRRLL